MKTKGNFKNRVLITLVIIIPFNNWGISSAQNFQFIQTNPFGIITSINYSSPAFADLDRDGDFDMLTGEINGNFYYYRNNGTASAPSFAAHQKNPFGLTVCGNYSTPAFGDLDGDGDLDIISGSMGGGFYYLKNNGTSSSPSYEAAQFNPFGLTLNGNYSSPTLADLDGDGDLDILSGSMDGTLYYYQNIGTPSSPSFAAVQVNPFGLNVCGNYSAPCFANFDGDGDIDILSGTMGGGFYYYQNNGTASSPSFATAQGGLFGLTASGNYSNPAFVDLDGDGDLDILSGSIGGSFYYFKNAPGSGIIESLKELLPILLYPNPCIGVIHVEINNLGILNDNQCEIIILNILGEKVFQSTIANQQSTIDISDKPKGIYIVKISVGNQINTFKIEVM